MDELRDMLYRITAEAASGGSLLAVDTLMDRDGGVPWTLEALERTESWPIRVRAAEML